MHNAGESMAVGHGVTLDLRYLCFAAFGRRRYLGFLPAKRRPFDDEDFYMHQVIDHDDNTTDLGKYLAPFEEDLVGGDQGVVFLMS